MQLKRTIERLALTTDCESLRRAARDVGHELHKARLAELASFRAAVAGLSQDGASEFVRGYRAALLDLVAAYSAGIDPRQVGVEYGALADKHEALQQRLATMDPFRFNKPTGLWECVFCGAGKIYGTRPQEHELTCLHRQAVEELALESQ